MLVMVPSTIPFLYFLLRVHISKCCYYCYCMTISVLFSLSLVKGPCLPHSYRTLTIQNRSAYRQHAAFVQAHRHTQPVCIRTDGFTHTGPLALAKKSDYGNLSALIKEHHHCRKSQPNDDQPHSYRPINIMQNVSLRTAGRTHIGQSPLGNTSI